MKKIIALLLCLMLALASVTAFAEEDAKESIGTINVNGAFELRCTVPEGYRVDSKEIPMDFGLLMVTILPEEETRPTMILSIAFDELLAEVDRLNDLDDDGLAQIEATFTEDNNVDISYLETAHGTKLMVVTDADNRDYADFYTIYKGYELEFLLLTSVEATEGLTDEQIQLAVDFLSDLDFVETNGIASPFVGDWFDETSQRATMEIAQLANGYYWVAISWADSADENTDWLMTGVAEGENTLSYVDGVKVFDTFGEDGELKDEEILFINSEGTLTLNEDGSISWADNQEETASQFVFRKAED